MGTPSVRLSIQVKGSAEPATSLLDSRCLQAPSRFRVGMAQTPRSLPAAHPPLAPGSPEFLLTTPSTAPNGLTEDRG